MFTMKKCDFRPVFFIFDLNASEANLTVGEQIFSQFLLKIIKYTSKITFKAIELTSSAKKWPLDFDFFSWFGFFVSKIDIFELLNPAPWDPGGKFLWKWMQLGVLKCPQPQ